MYSASTPGGMPLLRVLLDVPVLGASPTIEANGVAVDFHGYSFFLYVAGEQETTIGYTLTSRIPGALELVVSRCDAGGVGIWLFPRVATAVLAAAGATQPGFINVMGTPHTHITHRFDPVHMRRGRQRGEQMHRSGGFQPLSSSSDDEDEQPPQQLQPRLLKF